MDVLPIILAVCSLIAAGFSLYYGLKIGRKKRHILKWDDSIDDSTLKSE